MTRTEAIERATSLHLGRIDYREHPEECWDGVKAHYLFLSVVRNPSEELCMMALEQSGEAFRYIPEELFNPAILSLAVRNWERAIGHIPHWCLTEELCLEHVLVHHDLFYLWNIPFGLRTERLYEEGVRLNPKNIAFVPDDSMTEELVLLAVRSDAEVIKLIPRRFWTDEVIRLAVTGNKDVINLIKNPSEELIRLHKNHHG